MPRRRYEEDVDDEVENDEEEDDDVVRGRRGRDVVSRKGASARPRVASGVSRPAKARYVEPAANKRTTFAKGTKRSDGIPRRGGGGGGKRREAALDDDDDPGLDVGGEVDLTCA